ncbi:MAG: hypothetical protein MUE75_05160 [Algoriphagus sp.]|jgi:hypothetical protein|nr:hypothetical protein [Algoriphagus sp.]
MKRSIFTPLFLLAIVLSAQAQMQKGSWMVDGQVGISMDRQDNQIFDPTVGNYSNSYRQNGFSLSPGLGYFIQDHWALGLSPSFGMGWGEGELTGNSPVNFNSFEYGIGLFSRKYIPTGDKLSFFGDIRIGGFWGNLEENEEGSSNRIAHAKSSGLEAGASLGLQYLLRDWFGLHLQSALIDYRLNKETGTAPEASATTTSLNTRLFSSFQIGATLFF